MKSKRMGALLAVYCLSFMTLAGCSAENSRNYKQAAHLLVKLDARHAKYYFDYTGKKWGDAVNYDLCINSASYGIEESVELIERMINKYPNS